MIDRKIERSGEDQEKKIKKRFAVLHVKDKVKNFKYKNISIKNENFTGELYFYYFIEGVNKIVEWYFDIAREIGKENGLPYEDDMYLDVLKKH